ncbi:acyl-CoA dehydrogenase family protein, partial [Streptomyces sp. NPDC059398]|uniref:acyl-CoA dehydrogenase family protein n=1 Tax=Streptomyces sp. NPDC059398 TaxID=3346820 RepID=UPI00368DF304
MGIGITQEQRELAEAVRGLLAREVPPGKARARLDAPPGGDGGGGTGGRPGARPAHWDVLAGQGLLGAHLPEEYGGGGGGLVEQAVILEEAARAALPGPYLPTVLASAVLHRAGRPDLAAPLADGRRTGAVALGNPDDPVLGGAEADLVLLRHEGRWAAVDADGLDVRPQQSVDPTRPTAGVRLRGEIPADRLLTLDATLVTDLAAVLFAADACGTAAWALHTATEHAKVREQFGRPIGQFQAVKHLCADMLLRVEQARALTWDAARAAGEGADTAGTEAADAGVAGARAGPPAPPGGPPPRAPRRRARRPPP